MDIPDWDTHHRSIRALTELIEQRRPFLTSRPDMVARQFAAGYLARCRRLVLAMDHARTEFPDTIGLLLRPLFESWLTATWLLLSPDEALPVLQNNYQVEVEKMTRLAGIDLDHVDESWKGQLQGPSIAALAVRVGQLLVAAGDPGGESLAWSYDLVYRNESIYSVHGGLGPILSHLEEDGPHIAVLERRKGDGDGKGRLLWGAILLGILTRRVFITFGIGVEGLDELTSGLEALGRELNRQSLSSDGATTSEN